MFQAHVNHWRARYPLTEKPIMPDGLCDSALEREKLREELSLRDREVAVKEREQAAKEREINATIDDKRRSRWINPLVIAVLVAALAAAGNAGVALLNSWQQRELEETKAEAARILQVLETDNADKAAINLKFLLDTGLITDPKRLTELQTFLDQRRPGEGPTTAQTPSNEKAYIVQLATYLTRNCRTAQEEIDLYKGLFSPPPTLWRVPSGRYIAVGIKAPDADQATSLKDKAASLASRFPQNSLAAATIRVNAPWIPLRSCNDLQE
jgi:hypothetical protein